MTAAVEKLSRNRVTKTSTSARLTLAKLADMDRVKVTTQLRRLTKHRAFYYVAAVLRASRPYHAAN